MFVVVYLRNFQYQPHESDFNNRVTCKNHILINAFNSIITLSKYRKSFSMGKCNKAIIYSMLPTVNQYNLFL